MKAGLQPPDLAFGLFPSLGRGLGINNGVPKWEVWSNKNVAGFSAISISIFSYMIVGHLCFCDIEVEGTSNATTLTADLPFPVEIGNSSQFMSIANNQMLSSNASTIDNASSQATPGHAILLTGAPKTVTLRRDAAGNNYTASGTKAWRGQFFYPIKNPLASKYPQWKFCKSKATGFSSLNVDFIFHCQIGRMVFGIIYVLGVSNANSLIIQLPVPIPGNTNFSFAGIGRTNIYPISVLDNGNARCGRIFIGDNATAVSSKHATISTDMAGAVFVTSGTKAIRGGFYYLI